MEAIAAEASVTKPILYRSVGDRDALVIALSERFVQRVNVAAAHDVARATSPRDAVYLLVRAFLDTVEGQSNLFLFVTAGTVGRDRVARSLSLADLSAVPLADLLARLHSAGEPPDQLASLIWAHGMIGAMQYATLWWLRNRSCTTHELAEHLTQLIWSGIAPPGQ